MTRLSLPAIHPGEILRAQYMEPLGLKPYSLAKALRIPRTRIERLVREETPVTIDTALRLARYFGTTPELWMNIQLSFDLKTVSVEKQPELQKIEPRDLPRDLEAA